MMTDKPLILYIGGSGRSGSTLLDLLLNNHPQIQSVGEVHRLNLYARENTEPCTCGQAVAQCPFWLEVEREMRSRLCWSADRHPLVETEMMLVSNAVGRVRALLQKGALVGAPDAIARMVNRVVAPKHQRAIEVSVMWYEAICAVTKARVLIDSTKDARRLRLLHLQVPEQFRLLYVVRDGRAVAASAVRRTGMSIEEAGRGWSHANRKTQLAMRNVPDDQVMQIHYEQLCLDPEATLRRICGFLGLGFELQMLMLRKVEAHNIGGNPMRFRTDEQQIKLDERWREQLTPEEIEAFERVGGRMNRSLGYGD